VPAPPAIFRIGLVGQTLAILAVATTILLGGATWYLHQRAVSESRAGMLEHLRKQTTERTKREQAAFTRIERQVDHARRLLIQHWASGIAGMQPPALGFDGSRRLTATIDDPLAIFITAKAAPSPIDQQAAATAGYLLRELGPAWGDGLPGMTIAVPDRWIAGWGATQSAVIADLLPDDPIVLDADARTANSQRVTWSEAEYEPASGSWSISARVSVPLDGAGVAIISHVLPVVEVLQRSVAFSLPQSETIVYSDAGQVLACSWVDHPQSGSLGTISRLPGHRGEALRRLAQGGHLAELTFDPSSDLWLGITHIETPGWTMVSLLPNTVIEQQASAQTRSVLVVGMLLIASQVLLVWALLHHRIALPLRRLVGATARLTEGERILKLDDDRPDEIGDLARSFDKMDKAIDLSEQGLRATAAQLRERDQFNRALLDSAADAVVVMCDGIILEANPRCAELFGRSNAELIGQNFSALAPERQANGVLSTQLFADNCRLAVTEPQHFNWRAAKSDASEFQTEIGLTTVALPGAIRLLAVIRDVTERNRMEEQIRHAQKMESVGQLAGGVAHDFNNILTAIIGSTQLALEAKTPPAKKHELLNGILTASERAASLIRSLLDFSRKRRPVSTAVDVHSIIRETLAMLERSIDPRITVSCSLAADRSTVVGDSSQMQNALLNLFLNARDALPAGGRISITTAVTHCDAICAAALIGCPPAGAYLTIDIHDSGEGIDPAIVTRIFDPFFTTKPLGKGTGLGLAAVYRIVCDHHGGLAVTSVPGQGTSFLIHLPLSDAEVAAPISPPDDLPTQHGTILVIEDEKSVRMVAVELLRLLGYRTLEAIDGRDGVAVFQANHANIDAVLIDMEMPGLRGTECLRCLRAINPDVRAVLCSGFVRDDMEADWRDAGFISLVPKPYRLADLSRAIEFALQSSSTTGTPP